jgi:hypothetical protein
VTGTRDAVLVLRLWAEPHDRQVRGRLLTEGSRDGIVAVGVHDILAAVEAELLAFARGEGDGRSWR